MKRQFNRRRRRQAGASLALGLIILVVMTLLGLVSSAGHVLQQKALVASMDREFALRSAELALAWGESLLPFAPPDPCLINCDASSLVWNTAAMPGSIDQLGSAWWQQYTMEFGQDPTGNTTNPGFSMIRPPPRFLIEAAHQQDHQADDGAVYNVRYYRVYANGYSLQGGSDVILTSTFAVPRLPQTPGETKGGSVAVACAAITAKNPDIHCGRLAWRQIG